MKSSELLQQRAAIVATARQLHDKIKSEDRKASDDEASELEKLLADADKLKADADDAARSERLEHVEADVRHVNTRRTIPAAPKLDLITDQDRRAALRSWCLAETDHAERSADALYRAANCGIDLGSRVLSVRALSKGTNSAGGYDVPVGFASEIEKKLKWYCPIRSIVRTISTDSGIDLQWPVVDDTANAASIVSEAGAIGSSTDPTFSQITFKAWKYASPIVKVSTELLTDAQTNIEALLADLFAERMGRGQEADFLTGNGTSAPQGLITGATATVNLAAGNSITFSKLKALEHSLDIAYRQNAAWLMHDSTFSAIEQLVDGNNRPLFVQDLNNASQYKLFGYPVHVSNSFAAYSGNEGDNAAMILFGDFNRYIIRDISSSLQVARLSELFAANGQVGFVMLQRCDGRYINASAVKALNSYDAP